MSELLDQRWSVPRQQHGRRRRPAAIIGVAGGVVLLVLVAAVVWAVRARTADSRRVYLSTDGWPKAGQGAYLLGDDTPRASPEEQEAPIASLAKVMTALVVLDHHPLSGTDEGPTFVVRDSDVTDTAARAARDESVVTVRSGEQLSERQALMALLLPSANNVAIMLARFVSGTVDAFVYEMNKTANDLGMTHTLYTDPSGYDEGTVSTAIDQLTLAGHAADDHTLATMMSTTSYPLPVAGTVHNTDTLLGQAGFVGMKTGSDDAAGGCFMFHVYRSVNGVNTELIGVVMGQRGRNLIDAGLFAARQLADHVAPDPAHP